MSSTEVRARAYHFLGSLLVGDPATICRAAQVSPFCDELKNQLDEDIAAEHHRIFGLEVFPHAGVFTEDQALVGGRVANRVTHTLNSLGYTAIIGDGSPDHVGNIFRSAAILLQRDDDLLCQKLLCTCLVPWLVPWASAVLEQVSGFWGVVVQTCLELLGEHLNGAMPEVIELAPALEVSDLLGVTQIAEALTIPMIAGAFVGREDIRSLGRRFELPTGFGSRKTMLTNMLRSSAEYESAHIVMQALVLFFRKRGELMGNVVESVPGLSHQAAIPWTERALQTADVLHTMEVKLADSVSSTGARPK